MSFDDAIGHEAHDDGDDKPDENGRQMLLSEGPHPGQGGSNGGHDAARLGVFLRCRHWGPRWCGLGAGWCLGSGSRFWRISGLPCESGRDLGVHLGQHLQDRDAAGLLVHGRLAEDVIGNVFAAAILVREAPQVWAVAFAEIAPAVVLFRLVQDALDGPCRHLVERVRRHGERVDRRRLPRRERAATGRHKLGLAARPDDVLAVVQDAGKAHGGFAVVDRAHHEPRHAGLLLDGLIPRAVGQKLAGDGLGRRPLAGQHRGLGPQRAIAGGGLLEGGRHGQATSFSGCAPSMPTPTTSPGGSAFSGSGSAGSCNTVACWPSHSRVTGTIWPSGNSSASWWA